MMIFNQILILAIQNKRKNKRNRNIKKFQNSREKEIKSYHLIRKRINQVTTLLMIVMIVQLIKNQKIKVKNKIYQRKKPKIIGKKSKDQKMKIQINYNKLYHSKEIFYQVY